MLTVVVGEGPAWRRGAGRAILLDPRVGGVLREDRNVHVVPVGVPQGQGKSEVERASLGPSIEDKELTRTSDRCASCLNRDSRVSWLSSEARKENRGLLTEVDPDATLAESEVLLDAHEALQSDRQGGSQPVDQDWPRSY